MALKVKRMAQNVKDTNKQSAYYLVKK